MNKIIDTADRARLPYQSFAREVISQLSDDIERSALHHGVVTELAKTGWHGMTIPTEYGGLGLGHLHRFLSIEEVARVSPAAGAALQSAQLGTAMFVLFGSEEQKRYWLPMLASGEHIASICITEKNSGSHILRMECTATEDGDFYILNGRKCFIANSHVATVHGTVARTKPGTAADALSAFIVPADTPGCHPGEIHEISGLRGFNLGEVLFDNCRVPKANLIGGHGNGVRVAHRSITTAGKPNLAAVAVGAHAKALDLVLPYSEERAMYGRPLHRLDAVRGRLSSIFTTLQHSRLVNYYACELLDANQPADFWLISGKLAATENAVQACTDGIGILGARGGVEGYQVERCLRDALLTLSPAGTSDVQRKRLADIVTGHYTPA